MDLHNFLKKIYLFAIYVISPFYVAAIYSSSPSLIFVHLGENIPPCLFTVIKQARYLSTDCDIFLLIDRSCFLHLQDSYNDFFFTEKIQLQDLDQIPLSEEHSRFLENNKINPHLTDGLWFYAFERFFYLFDFIKQRKLQNIFHLENDSMLYVDLREIFPYFEKANIRLAAPFQSVVCAIPCFVFVKDASSLQPFIEHMLFEMQNYKGTAAHNAINDMRVLASFYQKFGNNYITPLPTLMPEYGSYHCKQKSLHRDVNETPLDFLSMNNSLFSNYLFDAATLGIYANGGDRKYFPNSGPGMLSSRSLFNPYFFNFTWLEDAKGRRVPSLSFKEKSYRIANLHFHSKMPEGYTSYCKTYEEFPLGHRP